MSSILKRFAQDETAITQDETGKEETATAPKRYIILKLKHMCRAINEECEMSIIKYF